MGLEAHLCSGTLYRPDTFNIAKLGTKDNQKPQKAIILSREVRREEFNQLKFR